MEIFQLPKVEPSCSVDLALSPDTGFEPALSITSMEKLGNLSIGVEKGSTSFEQ